MNPQRKDRHRARIKTELHVSNYVWHNYLVAHWRRSPHSSATRGTFVTRRGMGMS
jgi:hypothetical protein